MLVLIYTRPFLSRLPFTLKGTSQWWTNNYMSHLLAFSTRTIYTKACMIQKFWRGNKGASFSPPHCCQSCINSSCCSSTSLPCVSMPMHLIMCMVTENTSKHFHNVDGLTRHRSNKNRKVRIKAAETVLSSLFSLEYETRKHWDPTFPIVQYDCTFSSLKKIYFFQTPTVHSIFDRCLISRL